MFGLIVQAVSDMKLYITFVVHCGVLLMHKELVVVYCGVLLVHKELVVTKCCSSV